MPLLLFQSFNSKSCLSLFHSGLRSEKEEEYIYSSAGNYYYRKQCGKDRQEKWE